MELNYPGISILKKYNLDVNANAENFTSSENNSDLAEGNLTDLNDIKLIDYMTQAGDTLLGIALEFLPTVNGNRYQMLVAIHDINPAAFVNNNITLLKSEQKLLIPRQSEIDEIDPDQAQEIFESRWNQGIERFFAFKNQRF